MRHLVMFDVDGTLTQSMDADGRCYAQAMAEHLGMEIDTDWSTYRHATDPGIAHELFARAGRPPPTARGPRTDPPPSPDVAGGCDSHRRARVCACGWRRVAD